MSARRVFVNAITTALLVTAPLALAQRSGSNTGPTRSSRRDSSLDGQQERKPIFVSGRVTLDDGTPPPERVAIDRVCNGRTRREAYTDSHGAFGFQLGAGSELLQDASVGATDGIRSPGNPDGGGLGASSPVRVASAQPVGISLRDLTGCELTANASGYRSEPINLAGQQVFDNPNLGTLVLHRIGKVEGTRISVTTLQAPGNARKAFERAHNALSKNNKAEAEQELLKAVALYPKFAEALSDLGRLYLEKGRNDEAARLLQQAIEADPRFVPPYFNLAYLAGEQRDWTRMADLSERALALNPYEYPTAYFYDAIGNYNLHSLDAAEKSARMARRLDSQYHTPSIDYLLANILLQRDDYAGAAEHLQSFLKHRTTGAEAESARELLRNAESKLASAAQK